MAEPSHLHVSSFADLASRYRAYLLPGALEIEERASFEISSRRILFDEIYALTLHTAPRRGGGIAWLGVALLFAFVALLFNTGGESGVALGFVVAAVILGLPGIVLLVVPAHVITIYGMRGIDRVVFRFRASKAREWLGRLSREIERTQAQQRAAFSQ